MKIAIWGIKQTGQKLYNLIDKAAGHEIACFVDNNLTAHFDRKYTVPVVSQNTFFSEFVKRVDAIIISARNNDSIVEILDQLTGIYRKKIGIVNLAYVDYEKKIDLDSDSNAINWIDTISKPALWYLQAILTKQCNLNCKGCSHFANLFSKKSGTEYAFESFANDVDILSKKTSIFRFRLLGGEPFLIDNLDDFINYSRDKMPSTDIRIVTNGLLVPKVQPHILQTIKDKNVGLEISPYQPTIKMLNEIKRSLEQYDIDYSYNGYAIENDRIEKFAKNIDLKGCSDPLISMKKCFSRGCRTIYRGSLYKCPIDVYLPDFKKEYGLAMDMRSSGIAIEESVEWNSVIRDLNNEPISNCIYCSEQIKTFKWEQKTDSSLDDWVV